ncbi:MAG: 50S ribosomal protein L15 [Patescibacteria group bacterium]|nr:50S ribosomal protein L15 [bacterium]MDZ4227102.1 50S ribosomal protein L15 [Patescibacteria group bacterium]
MATLNQLKRMTKRPYRRVGRGQSSTRGKQSGRGGKGQTARAGAKVRPAMRDIIKKLPKRRGFGKNRSRTVVGTRPTALALSVSRLEALFEGGAEVTQKAFIEKKVVSARLHRPVKIVGGGELSKKFTLKGVPVSASARASIEKAGGSVA